MARRFESFIGSLAALPSTERLCNPWTRVDQGASERLRRRNLRLYLNAVDERGPDVALIGEALGYRGGRITGIPFTSPRLMIGGAHGVLGSTRGYRRPTDMAEIDGEASATIIWEAIGRMRSVPVLWNAVPFHPHHEGDRRTNRTPSADEMAMGAAYLGRFLRLFPIRTVVAVGRKASRALSSLGIDHVRVRHPAIGGKHEFLHGLEELGLIESLSR